MRCYPAQIVTIFVLTSFACICASAQTPDSAINHYRDGIKKVGKGDLDGALEDYSRAIVISSKLRGNNSKSGEDESEDLTVIDPFTANAYTNRGVVRYRKGDFEGAKRDFDSALQIKPNLAEAYLNRASALRELGDSEGSMSDLNTAIRLKPE